MPQRPGWCETPSGPCRKQTQPVLTNGQGIDGPGGAEFVSGSSDALAVVFHAWPEGSVGYGNGSTRRLRLGRIDITGDVVSIAPAKFPGDRRSQTHS